MRNAKQRQLLSLPCNSVDKISSLPGDVIDEVLSYLSLRDAVRTSVLSKNWRYKWRSIPSLVFNDKSVAVCSQYETVPIKKLVKIVHHVLSLYSGPINKFKVSLRDLKRAPHIDIWILFLSMTSVKEFILKLSMGRRYKLHFSLYLCQKLTHLKLRNCLLSPPVTFTGFKTLESLDLQHITIRQTAFEYLIQNCPLLTRLTLLHFDGVTDLKIHAPNLRFLDIGGVFKDVSFQGTSRLAIVYIELYSYAHFERNLVLGKPGNLVKFFAHLPRIQRLHIQDYFLRYLSAGTIPIKLPVVCHDLSCLVIDIDFSDVQETLAALCLIRSCPNLQELVLWGQTKEPDGMRIVADSLDEYYPDWSLDQLRVVDTVDLVGGKQEMSFIKFLLANSPALEKMTIHLAASDRGQWEMKKKLLKNLLSFRRASVNAQIIYQT